MEWWGLTGELPSVQDSGRKVSGVSDDVSRLTDLITPMAMRVVATLRIADRIAAGTTALADLAAETGTDRDALGRVLRYLAARDVFAEPEPGRFALTPAAEPLRDGHPDSVRGWLDLTGAVGRADLGFGALLDVVRTGQPGHALVHGRDFWDDLAADPALTASFDALMAGNRQWTAPTLAALDWSATAHVVDVGGGDGTLIIALLRAHPHLRGTVLDLPATAATAERAVADAGLADRCDVVVGSFFDPLPPGADVYLLSSIVHDWSDADATTILRRCAAAAGPGARVLLSELVATGAEDRQDFTHMDLRMLVYLGGRERTRDDFAVLTVAAGLEITAVRPTEWGNSILECVVAS